MIWQYYWMFSCRIYTLLNFGICLSCCRCLYSNNLEDFCTIFTYAPCWISYSGRFFNESLFSVSFLDLNADKNRNTYANILCVFAKSFKNLNYLIKSYVTSNVYFNILFNNILWSTCGKASSQYSLSFHKS